MKKILVPIDFSDTAMNALDYSVELAKHFEAELLIYHCFYVPDLAYDSILYMENGDANEKESMQSLEGLRTSILSENPELKIRTFCSSGQTVDQINKYAKEKGADYIVIGTHGAGYLEERIIGSTTSSLIKNAVTPVLVIDRNVKFKPLENIVLASDFIKTNNYKVLKPLKELVNHFKSHLCVLNVYQEESIVPTIGEIVASFELDKSLKHTKHTFFYANNNEIVDGINVFVKERQMDMVAMIARKHSFIERIFREPYTKAMVFHSQVPFLVLHE